MPGNIRRAEHFLHVLRRLVQYLRGRLETENVEKEGPVSFVASITAHAGIDQKTLRFCYERLHSLMLTLEITDTDEFLHIQTICDFATLVGTYTRGFSIIIEPFDERMPHIPDPVLQVDLVLSVLVLSFLAYSFFFFGLQEVVACLMYPKPDLKQLHALCQTDMQICKIYRYYGSSILKTVHN